MWDFFEKNSKFSALFCLVRGTTIEMLTYLEGQALQNRDG